MLHADLSVNFSAVEFCWHKCLKMAFSKCCLYLTALSGYTSKAPCQLYLCETLPADLLVLPRNLKEKKKVFLCDPWAVCWNFFNVPWGIPFYLMSPKESVIKEDSAGT